MARFFGRALLVLVLSAGLSACVGSDRDPGAGSGVEASTAPLSWTDDGADRADRDCAVVLRRAARMPGTGGFETDCTTGRCWFVWGFHIDVAEELVAAGASAAVLYQSGSDPTWWEAAAAVSEGVVVPGYERFLVRVFEHTVDPGMSLISLMRTRVEAIPFVRLPAGGRLFDHNRRPGDFDVYELTAETGWSVPEATEVCPAGPRPRSTVRFLAGWSEEQRGAIVGGGLLRIEYDPARLPDCRASYTFAPAWDVEAEGRFLPGGETFSGSVVSFASTGTGLRVDDPSPGAMEVDVPRGATSVELWFRNWSGMSYPCETWDSNFGQNYRFDVVNGTPEAPLWAGDWGNGLFRGCTHRPGLEEPVVVDSYLIERACLDVYADVYVPGLTDRAEPSPEHLLAQVERSVDGGEPIVDWLVFVGPVGNNYRYLWTMPRGEMTRSEWDTMRFAFRFSTDGIVWLHAGRGDGEPRTVVRDFWR